MGSNREVEWNAIVKPILASSYGSFNKNDLPDFIRSIVTSEDNIVDHAAEYDTFYSTFVLLAADYITQKLTDLPVNQVSSACDAARVLGAHMLRALEPGGGQHASPLSRAQLTDGLHMLCQGGALEHSDHVTLVAAMKMAKLPPHILTTTPNKPDDGSFKCDQKSRARQHGATLVLDHLSSLMFSSSAAGQTAANSDANNEATPTAGSQVKSLFYERNAVALQLLNAGDTLVQMCQSLPHLGRYLSRYSEYVTSGQLQLPASLSDAMNVRSSLQTLCADVTMVWRAVSLPLLEPLTVPLQTALVTLSGGCLLAALTVATACSVGQEEVESQAVDVVVRALEVYETVLNAMRNSSRCGGPAVQGLQMSAARLLFRGLLAFMQCVTAMGDKQERGKSPVKSREIRIIPSKVQQGLTVLMVALSSQALSCLSSLLTEVSPEALVFFQSPPAVDDVSCLLPGYSLTQLLIILATTSYRKAVSLHGKIRGASTATAGGTAAGALNTTFIDDSGGEEPGSDDESGSLLGQWLTRTLNPPESGLASPLRGAAADSSAAPAAVLIHKSDWHTETSLVPERGDPRGYLSLSAHVLRVFNSELLDTRYEPVRRYLQLNINEQQLAMLAAMVRDVETGGVWKGGASADQLYRELGSALTRLTHNLVASRLLTTQLQGTLLSQLGVSPWSDDPLADWPLHVRHRSLLLVAQVLLLRPAEEQETAVSGLWNRLIGTLTRRILNVDGTAAPVDADADDLNVEHAQLLLFLFHSLQLMQKKSVLHLCASAVVKVAAVLDGPMSTGQILLLSRLLALLEYIVHNLYETPAYLIEQVKCNLFSGGGCGVEPLYISCDEVERSVAEAVSDGTAAPTDSAQPSCYYTLTHNNLLSGDPARLDGLACIFLLCPPGYLDYEQFYSSLVSLLRIGDQPHLISADQSAPPSVHLLASTHYCFNLVWRLCVSLPPSIEFWETMASDDDAEPSSAVDDYPRLLLSLLWLPRVGHKLHTHTTRDALLKKGVPQSRVDRLLQSATLQSQDCGRQLQLLRRLSQVLRHDDTDSQQLPPRFLHLLTLHAHLATVQMCSDDMLARRCELERAAEIVSSSETPDSDSQQLVQPLLDVLLQLISDVAHHLRWSIVSDLGDVEGGESADQRLAYYHLLQFISLRAESQFPLADACLSSLPPAISTRLLHRTASVTDRTVHSPSTWKTRFSDHALPSEGYMNSIVMSHSSTLPLTPAHRTEAALKQLLLSLVCLAETLYNECIGDESVRSRISSALLPLALDASCQSSLQGCDLDSLVGTADSDQYRRACCSLVVSHVCKILQLQTRNIELAGTISEECVQFLEGMLESAAGRTALVELDRQGSSLLLTLLLSAGSDRVSVAYGVYVLKFCHELFQAADRSDNSELRLLCASLDGLADLPADGLRKWLCRLVMSLSADTSSPAVPRLEQRVESQQLLQQITAYLVREDSAVGHRVPRILLETMISIGGELFVPGRVSASHGGLLQAMAALASVGSGHGQLQLFTACTKWLIACKSYLCEKYVLDKLMDGVTAGRHGDVLEFTHALLAYIGDVVTALKLLGDHWRLPHLLGSTSPAPDGDVTAEPDSDWLEDAADDDSDCDDSDEDSLNNKLCTYTMTQREYMNQHWYHCHTCSMVDSVGACSVCVRVCHRGHDISYAKHGSFFCDCGAREDGSCQALVKRSRQPQQLEAAAATAATIRSATYTAESMLHSLLRRRTSGVPTAAADHQLSDRRHEEQLRRRQTLARQLEPLREALQAVVWRYDLVEYVLQLASQLLPAARAGCARVSPIGAHGRAAVALQQLHTLEKKFDNSDTLMLPTLGSQEGAFDNVRMTFSGEQGQTIRQLISAHMIRRVAMCCLSAPQGRRQHLAVSHEKGKIAVLQLSALLKQSEAAKRKLTLTRLASAPMPFTVLSIASNPCNEDVLAVCGLKDCHVLTFSSSGAVSDHLVLQPQLEAGNFIINGVWMPGSQTALALVTADFVKLYQLSQDVLSPCHYLLLPSGKIRDTCLVRLQDDTEHLVIMSSTGLIYTVEINDDSSSKHGPFYVTNILDFKHPEIKWSNGHICGGGVSIYFSHALQMLFFSFSQGKSFFAPLLSVSSSLENVQQIQLKPSGSGKPNWQPLCQWSEVLGHPGLVAAMTQSSSNPVLLMLRPDSVTVQEIRIVPTKSKITDMVLIRHSTTSAAEKRTTLIVLCEDGSLRIYMASPETTGFWLSPSLSPASVMSLQRPAQKKKAPKPSRAAGLVHFPPDFFESCSLLTDVEYGGTDVLQVYNTQQLKHRLNTSGLYVACTKPGGFSIDVTNNDQSMVICGVRVLVGTQEPQRAPAFLELLCRNVPLQCTRSRWFDVPLTREESLQTDRRLTLLFGPSQDPASVVMVDSIKLYGKTKESFEWPDDCDDALTSPPAAAASVSAAAGETAAARPVAPLDRLLCCCLETLDGCMVSCAESSPLRPAVLQLCTDTLQLDVPVSAGVSAHAESLLAVLHGTRAAYHSYKDQCRMGHVWSVLRRLNGVELANSLDSELFHHLVVACRSLALSRPASLVKNTAGPTTDDGAPTADGFIGLLVTLFWRLHDARPSNPLTAPVCTPGLTQVEPCVYALCDVLYAYMMSDSSSVPAITETLSTLLLSDSRTVSFATRHGLMRVLRPKLRRRRVYIPSPPVCSTAGGGSVSIERTAAGRPIRAAAPAAASAAPLQQHPPPEALEEEELVDDDDDDLDMESLLAQAQGLPLDLPPEADDEAMVELAIALSLQDQDSGAPALQNLRHHLQGLVGIEPNMGAQQLENLLDDGGAAAVAEPVERPSAAAPSEGHLSDTTASAPGSDDDEGSTAATDGSTLRTSPAEQAGSGGSESGASGVDSIAGEHLSARSSVYGDGTHESAAIARSETSSIGAPVSVYQPAVGEDSDTDTAGRLHALRVGLLERLLTYLPRVSQGSGVRAIPFFQVLLMLASDLDGSAERDRLCLDKLLKMLLTHLRLEDTDAAQQDRGTANEMNVVIMRMLSVLMSRPKSMSCSRQSEESAALIASSTAASLLQADTLTHCLHTLQHFLPHWKQSEADKDGTVVGGKLLKERCVSPVLDMSPFFLKDYVKRYGLEVFSTYPHLLTEMALRLPYQVKKGVSASASSNGSPLSLHVWQQTLCQYMMAPLTPFVRRQVRKLLLDLCGNKESYRQLRDLHMLHTHIQALRSLCGEDSPSDPVEPSSGSQQEGKRRDSVLYLGYNSLIEVVERLRSCQEVASSRTVNWQKFCAADDTVLSFLVHTSYRLAEGVAPIILQLLQLAAVQLNTSSSQLSASSSISSSSTTVNKPSTSGGSGKSAQQQSSLSSVLTKQLISLQTSSSGTMNRFIRTFLLDSNTVSTRWHCHALLLSIWRGSSVSDKLVLVEVLWKLWPLLPSYGRKAAQFVDILGYVSLKTDQAENMVCSYTERAVEMLRTQNQLLAGHANGQLYSGLSSLVQFDGYYLESEPCLVCNSPELPMTQIKLSGAKVDSRHTTTTQLVKLSGMHTISRIALRIADLKRSKMVRTINILYSNRTVQSVVELKNRPSIWHKAKKVTLTAGQTDVKLDFSLPIVACNLMIEYSSFYENMQASSETLQCPRCSANVPAHPGVCGNCGENVYQCHKCRAINYDEKDPFLCNACGFCKYGKFEYVLTARPCCAVDPIESEEDRKKAVAGINNYLDQADKIYRKLMSYKPSLETLLDWVTDHGGDASATTSIPAANATIAPSAAVPNNAAVAVSSSHVSRPIQQLAQKYCTDCKLAFDELSAVIQKVLASRRELLRYDTQSTDDTASSTAAYYQETTSHGRCYGCSSAAALSCVTLLRALATNPRLRTTLCSYGLLPQLLEHNLRRGPAQGRDEVCQLLCLLTKDNLPATLELNSLISERIQSSLSGSLTPSAFASAVRHEMALLQTAALKEDSCWEHRLRCVLGIFILANKERSSPVVMEAVTLPCLRVLQRVMQPPVPPAAPAAAGSTAAAQQHIAPARLAVTATVGTVGGALAAELDVNAARWLSHDNPHSFLAWRTHKHKLSAAARSADASRGQPAPARSLYLMDKYGSRWRRRTTQASISVTFLEASWLRRVIFNPCSRQARQMAADMAETLANEPVRKRKILDMLTGFLSDVIHAGEAAAEFLALFKKLMTGWKCYLASMGALSLLGGLITQEIEELNKLEETTLSSDLSQGYALKELTELMACLLDVDSVRDRYKSPLLGTVLHGYLSLRRLVIQRTKLVDETQDRLLQLLEDIISGNEAETRLFMSICVDYLAQCPLSDMRTPEFILERLCSTIKPEVNEVGPFMLSLEKDPQQEDFLQGRMAGNPYSSSDAGMGPLMRDVKNRICTDCELVALLEDDTGMELLVNSKIISLDLPVKQVYRRVWLPTATSEADPMRVVYRMRGLLGDATEEFIESLETNSNRDEDDEQTYKLASVMSECNGLQELLRRMERIEDLRRHGPLLCVLLRLLGLCIKTRQNRVTLISPQLRAVSVMLALLGRCLQEQLVAGPPIEQLLLLLEAVLAEAGSLPPEQFQLFADTCGTADDITLLLDHVTSTQRKPVGGVVQRLMRVLPFLTFGCDDKMRLLIERFLPVLEFDAYDAQPLPETAALLDACCALTEGIEHNSQGGRLKELLAGHGVLARALSYLQRHAPPGQRALLHSGDEQWRGFLQRPALHYVLRLLAGLAARHPPSQLAVAADSIPIIHRLEQVSSEQHVGTLAENLLEALRTNAEVASKIELVRKQTRQEKKRLAMAMRQHQLGALGMRANEKGQVVISSSVLKQLDSFTEETGLTCVICREGYKFQPTKVLGIYTFSKRCPLDEAEPRQRKTTGYTTVSHFNLVHIDCHMAAVRLARARDEWESAALQNANTRCNGLLPLWGPQVAESAFAHCLARHNTYLQEATGHRDVNYQTTVHDLKLLLLRLAQQRSLSQDSGGGGPQSNISLLPYMAHMALYVINTTRVAQRQAGSVQAQLVQTPAELWVESSFETDGPLYWCAMALLVTSADSWRRRTRVAALRRLLVLAHARHVLPAGGRALPAEHRQPLPYAVYRPYLLFLGLLDGLYTLVVPVAAEDADWSQTLAEYIRQNDQPLLDGCDALLRHYQSRLLTADSLADILEAMQLQQDVPDPQQFLHDTLQQTP